jgi:hypothetical protein
MFWKPARKKILLPRRGIPHTFQISIALSLNKAIAAVANLITIVE